jgi:hypothetical protein
MYVQYWVAYILTLLRVFSAMGRKPLQILYNKYGKFCHHTYNVQNLDLSNFTCKYNLLEDSTSMYLKKTFVELNIFYSTENYIRFS